MSTIDLRKEGGGIVQDLVDKVNAVVPDLSFSGLDHDPPSVDKAEYDTETFVASFKISVYYHKEVLGQKIEEKPFIEFTLNLKTGDMSDQKLVFTNPIQDFEVDVGAIKSLLEGDFVQALDLIPNFGLVKRDISSDYDEQQQKYFDEYGKENVYFASRDFVRWATPETAGRWIVELIATGGAAADGIAKDAEERVLKEITNIEDWLTGKAVGTVEAIAKKLIAGQPPGIPNVTIKLWWQKVMYKSTLFISGNQVGGSIPVGHGAFVFIWMDQGKEKQVKPIPNSGVLRPEASGPGIPDPTIEDIKNLTVQFYQAMIHGDKDKLLSFYRFPMESYFSKAIVSESDVVDDMNSYFQRWQSREGDLKAVEPVDGSPSSGLVIMRIVYVYKFLDQSGDPSSGTSTTTLVWKKFQDSWGVHEIFEKVDRDQD
jgi:hypothetical protein